MALGQYLTPLLKMAMVGWCQVPSPDARPLNPRVTPSQADEASLGPEYGEPTGDGRIDGGVRMVDLGLNPEVGPTRGSWSRERSEVDD